MAYDQSLHRVPGVSLTLEVDRRKVSVKPASPDLGLTSRMNGPDHISVVVDDYRTDGLKRQVSLSSASRVVSSFMIGCPSQPTRFRKYARHSGRYPGNRSLDEHCFFVNQMDLHTTVVKRLNRRTNADTRGELPIHLRRVL
jgi:hypothetical protein